MSLEGFFHGKSHRSKCMMTGGTPIVGKLHIMENGDRGISWRQTFSMICHGEILGGHGIFFSNNVVAILGRPGCV